MDLIVSVLEFYYLLCIYYIWFSFGVIKFDLTLKKSNILYISQFPVVVRYNYWKVRYIETILIIIR